MLFPFVFRRPAVKDKQKLTAAVAVFVAEGACSSSSSELLPNAYC